MNRDGHNHDKLDRILDQALDEIRAETLDPQTADGASERVWQRIAEEAASSAESEPARQEPLQRCDDFQALIPAFITDSLSDARRMLLEDHVRDCLACRKAVKQARGGLVL